MKNVLKLEEASMFVLCVYGLSQLHVSWWVYLLVLIAPDASFLGYAGGNKMGAFCYNFFHHKGIAVAIFLTGLILSNEWMQITGLVLFGHSSMDRTVGYGLKLNQGFKYTHLGEIGNKRELKIEHSIEH